MPILWFGEETSPSPVASQQPCRGLFRSGSASVDWGLSPMSGISPRCRFRGVGVAIPVVPATAIFALISARFCAACELFDNFTSPLVTRFLFSPLTKMLPHTSTRFVRTRRLEFASPTTCQQVRCSTKHCGLFATLDKFRFKYPEQPLRIANEQDTTLI